MARTKAIFLAFSAIASAPAIAQNTVGRNGLLNLFKVTIKAEEKFVKKKLKVGQEPYLLPLTESSLIQKEQADVFDFAAFSVRAPLFVRDRRLQVKDGSENFSGTAVADGAVQGNVFFIPLEATVKPYCRTVTTYLKNLKIKDYELCVEVQKSALTIVSGVSGPFFYRRKFSFWVQGGASFVGQQISSPTAGSENFGTRQLSARVGSGIFYKNIQAEVFTRQTVAQLSSTQFAPRWYQAAAGYGWELPSFGIFVPHVSLLAGFEYYTNDVKASEASARYIASYGNPVFGFRSRFAIRSRTEIGGDLLYTYAGGSDGKLFIQGDLRYWFSQKWALGAGYWIDWARFKTVDGRSRETSYALETYIRYSL